VKADEGRVVAIRQLLKDSPILQGLTVPAPGLGQVTIAEAERISKSYVSRVLRLALLAPDSMEAILAGTTGPAVGFEQLETGVPASWEEQRRSILGTATSCRNCQS
jgi:hypothetical protein